MQQKVASKSVRVCESERSNKDGEKNTQRKHTRGYGAALVSARWRFRYVVKSNLFKVSNNLCALLVSH